MQADAPAGPPAAARSARVAVVTGGNSGLGYETARGLLAAGFDVVLACRRPAAAEEAARKLRALQPDSRVRCAQLDLCSLASVRAFAATFCAPDAALHLLVNNAGCNYWGKRPASLVTEDGYGVCAQANFLGSAALTLLLLPALLRGQPSRVVGVSSVTHRGGSLPSVPAFLHEWGAGQYGDAKLASTCFGLELDVRCGRSPATAGLRSSLADPGAVYTPIWGGTPLGPRRAAASLARAVFAPPDDGARAVLHACLASPCPPQRGVAYWARGAFASAPLAAAGGATWALAAACAALVDWPLRRLTGWGAAARLATPAAAARDPAAAQRLWGAAEAAAGLPPGGAQCVLDAHRP